MLGELARRLPARSGAGSTTPTRLLARTGPRRSGRSSSRPPGVHDRGTREGERDGSCRAPTSPSRRWAGEPGMLPACWIARRRARLPRRPQLRRSSWRWHAAGVLSSIAWSALSRRTAAGSSKEAARRSPGDDGRPGRGPDRSRRSSQGIEASPLCNWNGPGADGHLGPVRGRGPCWTGLGGRAFAARRLPVACAFHSPFVAGASEPLAALALVDAALSPGGRSSRT